MDNLWEDTSELNTNIVMDLIDEIKEDTQTTVQSKSDLFLKLCAFNYLNALVKQTEYKGKVNYMSIKPAVLQMVIDLVKGEKTGLSDEISVKTDDDCIYIRCYGIQFSFHHINTKLLTREWPELSNTNAQWDGVTLQPIAEPLYNLAKKTVSYSIEENVVKDQIKLLLYTYGKL